MNATFSLPERSIGIAEMALDGTLILILRAEGPTALLGDARFEYAVSHPDYEPILRHVGGLGPGITKEVLPWPEGPAAAPQTLPNGLRSPSGEPIR